MPLPRAVLPAVAGAQDMELFSYLAVLPVHPVSSEMAEEMELAPVSLFLADCVGKMQCLSTVAFQTEYVCVCVHIYMDVHTFFVVNHFSLLSRS